jgi:hypothetical protein
MPMLMLNNNTENEYMNKIQWIFIFFDSSSRQVTKKFMLLRIKDAYFNTLKKIALKWWDGHKNWCILFSLIKMKIFIDLIPCFWVLTNFISHFWFLIKIMEWESWRVSIWSMKMKHQFLCLFHDPKYDLFSYFSHERHHFLILLFHGVKTSPFSLLVWLGSFLQNIRKFGSIATASKLRDLGQSLFVQKLLLNCL